MVHFAGRPVVGDNGETLVVHVKDQVLTLRKRIKICSSGMIRRTYHDGQADEANISSARQQLDIS